MSAITENFIAAGNKTTLSQIRCGEGIAKASSEPDGYAEKGFACVSPSSEVAAVVAKTLASAIVEAKGDSESPSEGLRQAYAESTNLALALMRFGVPAELVSVPIVCTTGNMMVFGVTRVLKPSFAYLIVTSKRLDLLDDKDRREAAVHMRRASEQRASSERRAHRHRRRGHTRHRWQKAHNNVHGLAHANWPSPSQVD